MDHYLKQMSQAYENEEIVVIMDQLGLYKSKDFFVPDNIAFICLPSYSPELNPIERCWKHMKTNYIHNRVFESLKQMMALILDVCRIENRYGFLFVSLRLSILIILQYKLCIICVICWSLFKFLSE